MVAGDEYRAVLSGEARPVDVTAIESEITQLWKAAAEDTLKGQPVVRACVLNLVAYAPGEDAARHINEVISQASGRHPSRSIVIVVEPGTLSAGLRASISAHCQIPPAGGKQVCSEQITLHASGATMDEAHGTVLPLLIPDLPVVLWWHDESALSGHLFRELLESSDHLIVDSVRFAPERATSALAALLPLAREDDVVLGDLNWSRLTHWRELVAQFFDSAPARRSLDRLERVSVELAVRGGETNLTEGFLLVGWLASRLAWTLKGRPRRQDGGVVLDLRGSSGPVSVELTADPAHSGEGLHSVVLQAAGGASFSISRQDAEEACVVVAAQIPEGGMYSHVVHMDLPSEATLLCDELDMVGRDEVFEEALTQAAQFMNGIR